MTKLIPKFQTPASPIYASMNDGRSARVSFTDDDLGTVNFIYPNGSTETGSIWATDNDVEVTADKPYWLRMRELQRWNNSPLNPKRNASDQFIEMLGNFTNNFTSPASWSYALRNSESPDEVAYNLFTPNSGFFTDNYAEEHPYITTGGNIVGEIGAGSALLPYRKVKNVINAINQATTNKQLVNIFSSLSLLNHMSELAGQTIPSKRMQAYLQNIRNKDVEDVKEALINAVENQSDPEDLYKTLYDNRATSSIINERRAARMGHPEAKATGSIKLPSLKRWTANLKTMHIKNDDNALKLMRHHPHYSAMPEQVQIMLDNAMKNSQQLYFSKFFNYISPYMKPNTSARIMERRLNKAREMGILKQGGKINGTT